MLELRPASPVAAEAHDILSEYFALRAREFPGGSYTTVFPNPDHFAPPQGIFLLAGPTGAPVGCGGIRRLESAEPEIRFEVKHLYLRPETRGQGWGRAILEDLERRARDWGAGELVLDTHHTLEAAGALYTRSGFVATERYNDNANATVWLRKVLD